MFRNILLASLVAVGMSSCSVMATVGGPAWMAPLPAVASAAG